ncbi:MAG: hypothetical protein Q8P05_02105 [Candidatus Diapherotrites archaeon]|nr:hypothetical protein [Candidatus Diapherotrites archaeon]MDZ4256664.1 hypothetical protein [archaeon]
MKLTFLPPKETLRYTHHLTQRYGIPFSIMRGWQWYAFGSKVYIVTPPSIPDETYNLYAAGLLAFTDGKSFTPTTNLITAIGKYITQNRVILEENHLSLFFARQPIPLTNGMTLNLLSPGFVAVSFDGHIIASARATQTHLIPNLPSSEHGQKEKGKG